MQEPRSTGRPPRSPADGSARWPATPALPDVLAAPAASVVPDVADSPAATAESRRRALLRRQLLALLGHEPTGHPPAP